jgi:hypothetical protein
MGMERADFQCWFDGMCQGDWINADKTLLCMRCKTDWKSSRIRLDEDLETCQLRYPESMHQILKMLVL